MSTLRDIRDYLRAEMGIPDLSEELIDEWVRSGLRRLNSESVWPWQKKTVTVTVPAAGTIDDGHILPRCRRVIVMQYAGRGELPQIEIGEALRRWPDVEHSAERPLVYTISQVADGQRVRLWPGAGSDTYPVTVEYYEWPAPWPTSSTPPTEQMPVDAAAAEAVQMWALNRALLREEQLAQASVLRAMFHQQVTNLRESLAVMPARLRVGADNRIGG